MSNAALNWAFSLHIKPATAKFVLVAMADQVGDSWLSFQSIPTLCTRTCLNKKTIQGALGRLSELSLIEDTGERTGRTMSVVVYRLSSPENGTAKPAQKRDGLDQEAGPFLSRSRPVFPAKQAQKRATDPKGTQGTQKKKRTCADEHPLFDRWYQKYPEKKSRGQARKAFSELDPDERLVSEMIEAIDRQKAERAAKVDRGDWVPDWKHPATWLNAQAWLDESDPAEGSDSRADYAAGAI